MQLLFDFSQNQTVSHDDIDEAIPGPGPSNFEITPTDDMDEDYEPPKEQASPEVTLTMNRKDLLHGTAELAARCNVSHRVSTAFAAKYVKLGQGKLQDFSLSKSTSHRHRKDELMKSEKNIKANFKEHMPEFLIMHWDGKVIKYEQRRETDERLAIMASVPQPDTPTQFLAAPLLENGSAESMRTALMDTIREWGIPFQSIIGMCWDTTSSNTGHKTGSAIQFEQQLTRSILWLACRHHVGELHVKHADIEARGHWNGML